jgi:hypothetical protein
LRGWVGDVSGGWVLEMINVIQKSCNGLENSVGFGFGRLCGRL